MGRFHWSHGHSKQSSDKLNGMTQDWFSKDTAEPSRQALNDLIKEHSSFESGTSDGSPKYRGRSRTNTVTSSFSMYARSMSDGSNDLSSRPSSRQSFGDLGPSAGDRQEHSAKSLISRGTRMLKRQGSKLSLLPSPSQDLFASGPDAGPQDPLPPSFRLQRQLTISSKRPALKKSISTPFAFQHLTHADQAQFQSLNTVTKTQLASNFDAVRAEQQAEDRVRGIPLSDLQSASSGMEHDTVEPASPTTDAIPLLPTTPPRPQPPPKDALLSPYSPSEFRMSRSMENFSRPTRLSVTASDVSPASALDAKLSALSPINQTSVLGKPLPLLPDIVHAVSTRDDSALPLPTAPLPSPPNVLAEVPEEEEEKPMGVMSSPTILPRTPGISHRSSRASSSPVHKRRSQSSGEIQFNAAFNNVMSMMTNNAATGSGIPEPLVPDTGKRISIGVKPIDIEDWEDAIDYSWDHATELDQVAVVTASNSKLLSNPDTSRQLPEKYLLVEQTAVEEVSSSASTPLMMQAVASASRESPSTDESSQKSKSTDEPSSPLLGLGIESLPSIPPISLAANEENEAGLNGHRYDCFSGYSRTPNSTMSKSSSQESIILSIASSIVGTHRSSNSSTSLSDFAHLVNLGDSMEKLDDIRGSTSSTDTRNRDGSQDTIRKEAIPPPSVASSPMESEDVSIDPKQHDQGGSASQITIPERKSSIPGAEASRAQGGRKRANTATSRQRRNTRVSYSLFPSAGPN